MPSFTDNSAKTGNISVSASNDKSDPRDLDLGPDFNEEMQRIGRISYDSHTGETTLGKQNFQYTPPEGNDEVGVLNSLKSQTGVPVTNMNDVPANSLVTIGKQTMTVQVAERLNLLARDSSGRIYDPAVGKPGSPEYNKFEKESRADKEEAETTTLEVSLKSEHVSNNIASLKEHTANVDGHINRIISTVCDGKDASNDVANLARAAGATAESVTAVMNEMLSDLIQGIAEYAQHRHGLKVDPDVFTDKIMDTWSPARRRSAFLSAYYNELRGIDNAIKYYMSGDKDNFKGK